MSNLLALPIELRLMIFRFLLLADRPLRLCITGRSASFQTTGMCTALLLVNLQTYREASDTLYTSNEVIITDFWGNDNNICAKTQSLLSREDRLWVRIIRKELYPKLFNRMSTVYLRIDWLYSMDDFSEHNLRWNSDWWSPAKVKKLMVRIRSIIDYMRAMAPNQKRILVLEFP